MNCLMMYCPLRVASSKQKMMDVRLKKMFMELGLGFLLWTLLVFLTGVLLGMQVGLN